jgi:Tol biopolymer transport system component/DNA-binding winged helix-turn-helix (wHTH) protein
MDARTFAFGPFMMDCSRLELRRLGVRLPLPVSRIRLLALFLSRPGELITRDEIAACLWKHPGNVDVVSGINTAVNQLRVCLGDDSAAPHYIETVIGAGYRFIADVTEIAATRSAGNTLETRYQENGNSSSIAVATQLADAATQAAEPASPAGTSPLPAEPQRHLLARLAAHPWKFAAFALAVSVILTGFLVYFRFLQTSPPEVHSQALELTRVTINGDIGVADISPDGKYVAYVRTVSGQKSIWLNQLATGRVMRIASIGDDSCPGVDFSPDGNYLYFARQKPLTAAGELYRIATLGGEPFRVLSGISGEPAVSPDGRKVAFVRSTLMTHGMDSIVVADIDGSNMRALVSYPAPGIRFNRLTWTADGQALAYPLQSTIMVLPVSGGTAQALPAAGWFAIDGVWGIAPGNELLVVGERDEPTYAQLYLVPLKGGPIRPVTHDFSDYIAVRATADGRSLLAVQKVLFNTLQTLAPEKESEPRLLSPGSLTRDGEQGLAITPAGDIVYTSYSDRSVSLAVMESSGNSHPLRENENFADPAISPSGDVMVATRWLPDSRANLFLINIKTGRETRLTDGKQDYSPSFTADGQSIVYASIQEDRPVLMKVSSQGGNPTRLTEYSADYPVVSPDGRWIACFYVPKPGNGPSLAIVPISGGSPIKTFDLPSTVASPVLAWTPDGRSISFIDERDETGNIWRQPVAGGPAVPVTHLKSGKIFCFQYSRRGLLVLSRGTQITDAVLIKHFR